MKVVIIEDEMAALQQLKSLLLNNDKYDIEVVEEIDSVEDSIEFFKSDKSSEVDLVFMDIHLSDGYSFSIFKHVDVSIPIIFTTAYDEYALKAFEVNCIDYILKPISSKDIDRIFKKIETIAQYTQSTGKRYIDTLLVMDSWFTVPLSIDRVAFFYKDGNKVKAVDLDGKMYTTNTTLEKLEEQLDMELFNRANRQYIVAKTAIKTIESYEGSRALLGLSVDMPEPLIISRTKVTSFKRWMKGE